MIIILDICPVPPPQDTTNKYIIIIIIIVITIIIINTPQYSTHTYGQGIQTICKVPRMKLTLTAKAAKR